ncbi:TetR family transcriptional regulator [Microbacterium suaedae]|uniref:TetR family transcriptional regulator n=1 Tax=Microbacterium suaedae TaxID=2067813 RepID=UPI000DA1E682|nr:TetR family transcriptional regulator [Microbacterium suaedae]
MPRASAAAARQTAESVCEAGEELFSKEGYSAISLDDVAQAAGVTRGAVYHHFRSKSGLFAAVTARVQSRVADAVVAAAAAAGGDPHERLRAGSHAFLDVITSSSAARILLIDAPAVVGWDEWRRLDAEHSAAHLREALADVGVRDELLDATTALLSGAMNEAALWVMNAENAEASRAHAHRVLDRILASVGP